MRNRHLPRLCRDCEAPMAGQGDACWRCGARWASEEAPRTTLRLIPAAVTSQLEHVPERRIALDVAAPVAAVSARG
jgi:predicted amidophosphoribosyltransferase